MIGRSRLISEFEGSLVYTHSSRTANATQKNTVKKKKKAGVGLGWGGYSNYNSRLPFIARKSGQVLEVSTVRSREN